MKQLTFIFCIIMVFFLSQCSGSSSSSGGTQQALWDTAETITNFDNDNIEASFVKLNHYIVQPELHEETASTAVTYLDSTEDFMTRYSAIYLLGGTGNGTDHGTALLEVMNNDADSRLQILAAGILISWGYAEAIPILIESLSSSDYLPFTPNRPIWLLAQQALPHYTNQDFDLSTATDSTTVAATQSDWESWWSTSGSGLTWNSSSETYTN